jgi:hypothetical protein
MNAIMDKIDTLSAKVDAQNSSTNSEEGDSELTDEQKEQLLADTV